MEGRTTAVIIVFHCVSSSLPFSSAANDYPVSGCRSNNSSINGITEPHTDENSPFSVGSRALCVTSSSCSAPSTNPAFSAFWHRCTCSHTQLARSAGSHSRAKKQPASSSASDDDCCSTSSTGQRGAARRQKSWGSPVLQRLDPSLASAASALPAVPASFEALSFVLGVLGVLGVLSALGALGVLSALSVLSALGALSTLSALSALSALDVLGTQDCV